MKKKLLRPLAVCAAALAASAGLTILGATGADAAYSNDSLAITPATGSDATAPVVNTSGPCPASATNLQVRIAGPGFATFAGAVGNSSISAYGVNGQGGYTVPFSSTLRDIGNTQAPVVSYLGRYTVTLFCRTATNATSLKDFTGFINFTSANTAYTAEAVTSAVLTASPASPQFQGTPVTFTTTISPAAATGSVEFFDGATSLGSAVVSGGTASITRSNLSVATHTITSDFTPTGVAYRPSSSNAISYDIQTPPPATATTTTLAVTPASSAATSTPTNFDDVTLTATISPAAATGSVVFKNGANTLATVPVSSGSAAYVQKFGAGTHSFTAEFVPANAAVYTASNSGAAQSYVVYQGGVSDYQDVTTTVAAGGLTITVADRTVVLPDAVLNAAGDLFTTAGNSNPVQVTDTRAASPGWTTSGQVTDFNAGATYNAAAPGAINGDNLGWSPLVDSQATSQNVTAGPAVAPAYGLAVGAANPNPAQGLKTSRTLASAPSGAANGTAFLSAGLSLNVPTSTSAGTYTARLTFTAI